MNTVRMVDYDQMREYTFGDDISLKENLAIGLINPEDFKNLNLTSSLNLKLTSIYGTVVICPKQDENIPKGTITLPISIWANQITGVENNELVYKNINVNVEATRDTILNIKDILNSISE
ncbi:MAG: molybdopterin dinucleotide binding domain-containing protein [Candidatus Hodarchaeota archaeon]